MVLVLRYFFGFFLPPIYWLLIIIFLILKSFFSHFSNHCLFIHSVAVVLQYLLLLLQGFWVCFKVFFAPYIVSVSSGFFFFLKWSCQTSGFLQRSILFLSFHTKWGNKKICKWVGLVYSRLHLEMREQATFFIGESKQHVCMKTFFLKYHLVFQIFLWAFMFWH